MFTLCQPNATWKEHAIVVTTIKLKGNQRTMEIIVNTDHLTGLPTRLEVFMATFKQSTLANFLPLRNPRLPDSHKVPSMLRSFLQTKVIQHRKTLEDNVCWLLFYCQDHLYKGFPGILL